MTNQFKIYLLKELKIWSTFQGSYISDEGQDFISKYLILNKELRNILINKDILQLEKEIRLEKIKLIRS